MLSAGLLQKVDRYWATFLGCPPEALSGTKPVTVTSRQSPGLVALSRAVGDLTRLSPSPAGREGGGAEDSVASLPPLRAQRRGSATPPPSLRRKEVKGLDALPGSETNWILSLAPEIDVEAVAPLVQALGRWRPSVAATVGLHPESGHGQAGALRNLLAAVGLTEVYGPAQVLYCEPASFRPGDEAGVRPLTAEDGPAVARFRMGMGRLAWHLDDPERWIAAFGLFNGDELISAAAIQIWGDCIGEVYVDTLPQYRGRGYATMLTRTATQWLLAETSLIPQYDAELTNPASLRVAQTVGYVPYGWLFMAVRS